LSAVWRWVDLPRESMVGYLGGFVWWGWQSGLFGRFGGVEFGAP
jgi:hypothetical protein